MSKVAETMFYDAKNHLIKLELHYSDKKVMTVSGKNITEDSGAIYFSSKNEIQTAIAKIVVTDKRIVSEEFINTAIEIFEQASEKDSNLDLTKVKDNPKLVAASKHMGFVQEELTNVDVFTEEEATNTCKIKIQDTITNLNIDFLAKHMKFSEYDEIMGMNFRTKEEVLEKIEDCNENGDKELSKFLINFYVKDMDGLVEDYIDLAGRGEILNPVNQREHEVEVDGIIYYVYDK